MTVSIVESAAGEMREPDLLIERRGPFAILPVLHHSFEFTLVAAEAFRRLNPCSVAVEYPWIFQKLIQQGVTRLPRISILRSGTTYIRIEPVDPFAEAARLALENGLEFQCIDLAVAMYPQINDPLPDTYAMRFLGHKRYCEMVLKAGTRFRAEEDESRESAMAYHLQDLQAHLGFSAQTETDRPILIFCGLFHLEGLLNQLARKQPRPFQPEVPAKLYHLSSQSLGEIMGCFPFLTAVYELQRRPFTPPPVRNEAPPAEDEPGWKVVEGGKPQDLTDFVNRAHSETSYRRPPDRYDLLIQYIYWCRSYYEQEIGDRVSPQSMGMLNHFARKYAGIKNMLLPDFYELLIAGRSCINSHFCYRMWEIGTSYPPQQGPSEIEIIELRASDIFPLVEKVRMNPQAPLKPRSAWPRFLRRSEKQRKPKDQDIQFHPFSICSYQPEDMVIEDYGRYLRSKGKSMLSEERKRIRPFETSLLDGIDLRETIRHWHSGNIYVQEFMTIRGGVDSLVVIYDEDDTKYPYTMTWLGEHHQESDMAFYATDPVERPVGPGIQKAVYGGFLMTMPPGRLYDVFHDPAYRIADNHAERLLLASIDYGLERFVLYAAPRPPRPFLQVIAGRYGKRILHIPLAQLSPVMLQRIRTFHILAHKSLRQYAGDYIW